MVFGSWNLAMLLSVAMCVFQRGQHPQKDLARAWEQAYPVARQRRLRLVSIPTVPRCRLSQNGNVLSHTVKRRSFILTIFIASKKDGSGAALEERARA